MEHNLFKPKSFEEARNSVVGDCNGIPMDVRYREETPFFAKKILELADDSPVILDYGCGVGRLAKELLKQRGDIAIVGVDASREMLDQAQENVNHENFRTCLPQDLDSCIKFDVAYLVYVLQHIPSIEIREALQRIHFHLRDSGYLLYCSSDYRMAIRHDDGGFFDDRFLGVNLQEELSRYFDLIGPAFTTAELDQNEVVKTMVTGGNNGIKHPALIYKKKKIDGPLFNAVLKSETVVLKDVTRPKKSVNDRGAKLAPKKDVVTNGVTNGVTKESVLSDTKKNSNGDIKPVAKNTAIKLILIQKQAPGDIMMATVALRDLHRAYPKEYITDIRTPCQDIFTNNPYITPILVDDAREEHRIIEELKADDKHPPIKYDNIIFCNLHYPMVHESGYLGSHFADGMPAFLSKQLGRPIPRTGLRPEIYLSQDEQNWLSPVALKTGYDGKYWVINAGVKSDFPLKQYPYYQEVVDMCGDDIEFVQIGQSEHEHKPLKKVVNMIGKTDLRELFRVIYKAEGVLTCVSVPMHIAAAFEKPCVVVAGGREGPRWEYYPDHRYLAVNGTLSCAKFDGCWKNTIADCSKMEQGVPLCMKMIRPEDVARAIELYYIGQILKNE